AGWVVVFTGCWTSHVRQQFRIRIAQTLPGSDFAELVAASTSPLPFELARVALAAANDARTIDALKVAAGEDRREHEAYLHALGPVLRNQELMMEQAFDEQLERHWPVSGELREMSVEFAARDTARFSSEGIAWVGAVLVPILIVAWPSAWL